jgi:predicted dehydrogenase
MTSASIALLGCGRIARGVHLPALARLPGAHVVALADADPVSLQKAAAIAPGAQCFEDSERAIEAEGVDAVIVCLPPALHAEATKRSLSAGKHVYVEKPLAVDPDEGSALVEARRRAGTIGAVGFNYRADAAYAAMREWARSDGSWVHARSVFTSAPGALPEWKTRRATGGGVLLDLGSHHFDLYGHALGARIVEVHATTRTRKSEQDSASVRAAFADATTAESHFAFGTVDEDRFEVYCEGDKHSFDRYAKVHDRQRRAQVRYGRATLLADGVSQIARTLARMARPSGEPSFAASLAAFVRAIGSDGAPLASFEDGLRSLQIVDAAERSADSTRVVAVGS